MKKLRYDLNMLHGFTERTFEAAKKSLGYEESLRKPLRKPIPADVFAGPPFPVNPPETRIIYVLTNSNSRMQADPEWLRSINGTLYYADDESVKRMQRRLQALERLLQEAKTIEENR